MEQRRLGRTGLSVSVLGYGCGAIGSLMVNGSAAERDRAISRALDHGITYFDTAAVYGDGASEPQSGARAARRAQSRGRHQGARLHRTARRFREPHHRLSGRQPERLGRDGVDIAAHNHHLRRDQDAFTASRSERGGALLERARDAGKFTSSASPAW